MRVATWNVNSVKQRIPRLLPWLDERAPDVVCLQETKVSDDAFAAELGDELSSRGYEFAHVGQGQWNGVAVLSRVGLDDVRAAFPDAPGFPDPAGPPEGRAVSAVCDGIRIWSVYVPNGREVDSDHYRYKLAWLDKLRAAVAPDAADSMVCGDFNIIPADADVFDPAALEGHTHVTAPERAELQGLLDLGMADTGRAHWPDARMYSYWDYRAGMFHKDLGMRIDLIVAGDPIARRVQAAWVDRQARKGTKPSDHAPVIVDLDVAPDGNCGPMVPPPSRPAKVAPGSVKLPHSVAD
ncbi:MULTISPECIES: exodeoxyribonuclease III [unclassified Gordonia (in: high G+C Gram-positive bacteria)]|uniref:exodeoxyribonuclease III n=1 Tax=unclassified Gordonia (in: high G+C Gram-positive bacteria) TaxID=2657482 RepID=UPI0020002125|nr:MULTISPECIES: exodeoxyribonuclease III [unclassified Gordonia (in: high G+C Gram-positive bacteria)]UQE74497.1 exodeoxyribonuclease III [Gordonia sp. PP30]